MKAAQAPKSATGYGWILCIAFAAWMFVLNGGNTRTEFAQGWAEARSDAPTAEVAADQGEG